MKILITGICGFVGSAIARHLRDEFPEAEIFGLDNLIRPGSETNRRLSGLRIRVHHGDLRLPSDLETLPPADWVIDAAANPSVLAGVDGKSSSRQLVEHNLLGTINILEHCRRHQSGLILLSTSRVYSITDLAAIPLHKNGSRYDPDPSAPPVPGLTPGGVAENFPTRAPVSLYGATKLASEQLALEYGATYNLPVRVNRCGVLAGPGQFGTAEQGIFSYWLHAWKARRPLRYIGFDGTGAQVRDALHPLDLAALLVLQIRQPQHPAPPVLNISGGLENSMSLAQLSEWCQHRFGPHAVHSDPAPRPFDIPWLVLDSAPARHAWDWRPALTLPHILNQIATHADENPGWLQKVEP